MTNAPSRGWKLTPEQVHQIRADKRPSREIAADYGISASLVQKIKAKTLWGELPQDPERPTFVRQVGRQHDAPVKHRKRGERLTEDQARAILADQRRVAAIAADYGISMTMVTLIKQGKRWGHVQADLQVK